MMTVLFLVTIMCDYCLYSLKSLDLVCMKELDKKVSLAFDDVHGYSILPECVIHVGWVN